MATPRSTAQAQPGQQRNNPRFQTNAGHWLLDSALSQMLGTKANSPENGAFRSHMPHVFPKRFPQRLCLTLSYGLICLFPMPDPADARQMPRPVIRLSCPDAGSRMLCDGLIQALATLATGGHVVRLVARDDVQPGRDQDVGVVLEQDTAGARLIWQVRGAAPQGGPARALPASGDPKVIAGFARTLAETTPGLIAALTRARD